jgi:hypothetical protein
MSSKHPTKPTKHRVSLILGLLAFAFGRWLCGTQAHAIEPPLFPATWLNGPRLSVEGLAGKVVILWFINPAHERARQEWATVLESVQTYKDKPVVFIAVNSGNDSMLMAKTIIEWKINWPVIIDQNRIYEKDTDVTVIGGDNFVQVMVITPKGDMVQGDWTDVDSTIHKYIDSARWKVDIDKVPPAMRPTWSLVEHGLYPPALSGVRRFISSTDTKVKVAAIMLDAAIKDDIDRRYIEAKFRSQSKKPKVRWEAYKYLSRYAAEFNQFPQGDKARTYLKILAKEEHIKRQLYAAGTLAQAKLALYGTDGGSAPKLSPAKSRQIESSLWVLVKQYEYTEGGKKAAGILAKLAP